MSMASQMHMLWETNHWSSVALLLYPAVTEIQWDCMYSVEDNCYSCKHCFCKKQPWQFRGANYRLLCVVSDEKPFKCSQCESSFRKSSGLKQHVTRQHSQNTPQKSTQAQTNQSNKKGSSANDRPYACQVRPTCPPVSKYHMCCSYFTVLQ